MEWAANSLKMKPPLIAESTYQYHVQTWRWKTRIRLQKIKNSFHPRDQQQRQFTLWTDKEARQPIAQSSLIKNLKRTQCPRGNDAEVLTKQASMPASIQPFMQTLKKVNHHMKADGDVFTIASGFQGVHIFWNHEAAALALAVRWFKNVVVHGGERRKTRCS